MSHEAKSRWRTEAKRRRRDNLTQRRARDAALVSSLDVWLRDRWDGGGVVVLYDALHGEADVSPLTDAGHDNIAYAITRTPDIGFRLSVHPIDSEMEQHRFGYRQPVVSAPLIADEDISAVLVPALAFDPWGNRLGFGAGYYDRFLGRLPNVLKIGVADVLVDERLPTEKFDVPMTHIATPHDGVNEVLPS